jgi:hypothetical protein
MTRTISNSDDIIDSRDIIERIDELRDERDSAADGWEPGSDEPKPQALADWEASDEAAELKTLEAVASDGEGYGDWDHGETLIRETYFIEYAQQLAEDIGAIDPKASWPNGCIDWEKAADELRVDYTEVDFDGVTYLMRA